MNSNSSNTRAAVRILNVLGFNPEARAVPIEIKFTSTNRQGNDTLPALLSRTRCGQETRKTVALAPRQTQLTNA